MWGESWVAAYTRYPSQHSAVGAVVLSYFHWFICLQEQIELLIYAEWRKWPLETKTRAALLIRKQWKMHRRRKVRGIDALVCDSKRPAPKAVWHSQGIQGVSTHPHPAEGAGPSSGFGCEASVNSHLPLSTGKTDATHQPCGYSCANCLAPHSNSACILMVLRVIAQ